MRIEAIKGDYIPIQMVIGENSTNWKIRAEISDNHSHKVRKASSNVAGGGDDQAIIVDVQKGTFYLYFESGDTSALTGDIKLIVEVESPEGIKKTIYDDYIYLYEDNLTWNSTTD